MTIPEYFGKYNNLAFSRGDDGVLVLRCHTDGGPIVFTGQAREEFPVALEDIALDPGNKAMVLTGTGDSFMDQIDGPSLGEIFKPAAWEKTRTEGTKVLQRLLDLPMPVIGVANGPATVHAEYLLLADIHIASERASYGDFPHPAFGITGGDGVHVVWEEVAGTARAKWLLWTGETIDAQTALNWAWSARSSPTTGPSPAASRSPAAWPPNPPSTAPCKSRPSISTSAAASPATSPSAWPSKASPPRTCLTRSRRDVWSPAGAGGPHRIRRPSDGCPPHVGMMLEPGGPPASSRCRSGWS